MWATALSLLWHHPQAKFFFSVVNIETSIVTLSSYYESISNRIESCASRNAAPEGLLFDSNIAFSKVVFPFFICSTRVFVFHCCYSWIVIYCEMAHSPLVSLFGECICYLYCFFNRERDVWVYLQVSSIVFLFLRPSAVIKSALAYSNRHDNGRFEDKHTRLHSEGFLTGTYAGL